MEGLVVDHGFLRRGAGTPLRLHRFGLPFRYTRYRRTSCSPAANAVHTRTRSPRNAYATRRIRPESVSPTIG
jgi:hypothetical protein